MALSTLAPDVTRAQHPLRAAAAIPGGRRAALVASDRGRGVRTRISRRSASGCPLSPPITSRRPATRRCSTSRCPSWRRPKLGADQEDGLWPRRLSERPPRCTSIARGHSSRLRLGAHGLPLMGSGDWNDGMNRLAHRGGAKASGSAGSCCATLDALCRARRGARAMPPRVAAASSTRGTAVAVEGAPGMVDWYRRGYFDDGSPLGSASNDECRIDAHSPGLGGDVRAPVGRAPRTRWPPWWSTCFARRISG